VLVASAVGAGGLAAAAEPLAAVIVESAPGGGVPELSALLSALSAGVLGYGVHGHLVRVMAARHRAPTAAWASAVGWGLGIALAGFFAMRADGAVDVASAIGGGFSAGLLVGAGLLLLALRRDAGPSALSGALRLGLASGAAALCVGLVGHALLSGGSGGSSVWVAIAQVLAAGGVAVLVVGGAAALADPSSVRSLLRVRSPASDGMT
jgi:putative peptidoglycan lipid II flippase